MVSNANCINRKSSIDDKTLSVLSRYNQDEEGILVL
jgi:hypothetical protein